MKPVTGGGAYWSSRPAFILAAVGAAVGLGNIWKFPYVTGVSGGGAFVLVYVVCALFVAIPILMGELLIGRRGRRSPPNAVSALARESASSTSWSIIGWLGVMAGYLILSYYSVIAGWAVAFVIDAGSGVFAGLSAEGVSAHFDELLRSPARLVFWHGLFMALSVLIVARGLQKGIESAVKILMPALFIMLLAMIGYSAVAGDMSAGLNFLFQPDFSKIDANVVLAAIGQAFFSIGVAMGLMMAYGAYIPKEVSITRSVFIIATADTAVAILAGIAIFPLVFANDLNPGEGPGLIFVTLPIAFGQMPGGTLFGTLFFVLLTFAALTSAIAILEPMVAWVTERFPIRRAPATIIFGFLAWLIGLASAFSFNIWSRVQPLNSLPTFSGKTLFDLIDYLTANIMMPLGGMLIAIFVGWRMSKASLLDELGLPDEWMFKTWRFLVRFVAPLAILAIFITNLG